MNSARVTVGSSLGAVVAFVLAKWGVNVSGAEAALIGSAAAGIGVALAHVVAEQGVVPAIRRILFGPPRVVIVRAEASESLSH